MSKVFGGLIRARCEMSRVLELIFLTCPIITRRCPGDFFCINIAPFKKKLPYIVASKDRLFPGKPTGITFCTDKSGLAFIFDI